MKTWQQRVQEIEAKGWTLTSIAKVIGITPQSVSDIKTGQTTEPKGMAAVKLCDLYEQVTRRDRL